MKKLKRSALRSPLMTDLLYLTEDNVLKATARNISTGGTLLGELPCIPPIKLIPMMIDLPIIPLFNNLDHKKILSLNPNTFEHKIIRVRAKIVRSFEGQSEVDKVFTKNIGCEFVRLKLDELEAIENYVEHFAQNTVFLLNLFESTRIKSQHPDLIRTVAGLMGYLNINKIMLLRQKVLHDYQSLESL